MPPGMAARRAARRERQPPRPHGDRSDSPIARGAARAGFTALAVTLAASGGATAQEAEAVRRVVDETVRPLMRAHDVPGMAVGVTVGGRAYVFAYGVASRETGRPVDDDTLFEIGSLSKTFTATLGGYAEALGRLSLADRAERSLPELAGSPLGAAPLRDLATYSAAGLPLQFPDEVKGREAMTAYFRSWRPSAPVGETRRYSNPSIGLFGLAVARSMGGTFREESEDRLFPALGLSRTYVSVPDERMQDYAFGYSSAGKPVRVNPGLLDAEAYGVKTTAGDMVRFLQANIDPSGLEPPLRRAIALTQLGYLAAGPMAQGLGWEIYADPSDLGALIEGNAPAFALKANPARRFEPPSPPQADALYAKTGSTGGFGAFAAFAPERRIGVALLANRAYPIEARLKAAHRILMTLGAAAPPKP